MKAKRKPIPRFRTEDEESAFWDKESPLDYLDAGKARKVVLSDLKPSTEVISLRLPAGLLHDIKVLANKNDVPYQSYLKILLADKVKERLADYDPAG